MENLQQATEHICDLKGSVMALEALMCAVLRSMRPEQRMLVRGDFALEAEAARVVLLNGQVSEHTVAAFERDVQRASSILAGLDPRS